jgi:hypothetical protein
MGHCHVKAVNGCLIVFAAVRARPKWLKLGEARWSAEPRSTSKTRYRDNALKRILKLDRLRLRGPNGARDEFHLAATAQNLRKLAKLIPMPTPALA